MYDTFLVMQYVETPLLDDVPSYLIDFLRDNIGFVKMDRVLDGK